MEIAPRAPVPGRGRREGRPGTKHDYTQELAAAMRAAQQAADMLRREFHRPGGPRRDGAGAAVDADVELAIHRALLGAFPDDDWLGVASEGRTRGAPRAWHVAPHDGSSAFVRGWRGSAVSIGLVVEGAPVLGVVFAPLAPDDGGDLFAWALDEPLQRNGRIVERAVLPGALAADHEVLVDPGAEDGRAAEHVRACAPARFRVVPSAAYRLALVAAGDADAAVGVAGTTRSALAGGHALLCAAGGKLLDGGGRDTDGGPITRVLRGWFGGHPAVASELARREWPAVPRAARAQPARRSRLLVQSLFPVRPDSPRVADAAVLARGQGGFLGQLVGDALGQMVEFRTAAEIAASHSDGVRELRDGGTWDTIAGQPTDDSELALALARTIVATGGFEATRVLEAYRDWLRSGPFDCGRTVRVGLEGRPDPESESNGSLMRVSPLAIHGWSMSPTVLAALAREDAALTHPNPLCGDAAAAFSVAIAHAVRTGEGPRETWQAVRRWAFSDEAMSMPLRALFSGLDVAPPVDVDGEYMGWVLITLQNAFHQLLHAPSFEEGLVATIALGGDTDTNAAVAGALLGAVHGRSAIPRRWQAAILTCRPVATRRARPEAFWPVDALVLAELLLGLGVGVARRRPGDGPSTS